MFINTTFAKVHIIYAGWEYPGHSNMTLSDRRLIEVARAMVSKPQITLLDEPMAGLNPSKIRNMLHVIEKTRMDARTPSKFLWCFHCFSYTVFAEWYNKLYNRA